MILTVVGAYGRDYQSWEAVISDWERGCDFKVVNGPYCSKRDIGTLKQLGYQYLDFVWDVKAKKHKTVTLK